MALLELEVVGLFLFPLPYDHGQDHMEEGVDRTVRTYYIPGGKDAWELGDIEGLEIRVHVDDMRQVACP